MTKKCTKCKTEKSLEEFSFQKGGIYKQSWCKKCSNKSKHLRSRYNISIDEYNSVLDKANHSCEICGSKYLLHLDHSHLTGKIRGILCQSCNHALGHAKDDIKILAKLIEYLVEREDRGQ